MNTIVAKKTSNDIIGKMKYLSKLNQYGYVLCRGKLKLYDTK